MLAITGDFDTETLIAQLEKVFEGWETAEIMFPDIPTVDAMPKPSVNYIFKDLNQTTMLIGHFGIKRTPDFPGLFRAPGHERYSRRGRFHLSSHERST